MASDAVTATTIKKFLKGEWDNTKEYNPVFALLKRKGNIKTGQSGTSLDWVIRAGRHTPRVVTDFEDLTPDVKRHNLFARCNIQWGEILVDDAASKGEFAQQGRETALVNLMENRVPRMAEDLIDDGLGYKFFNQSDATALDYVGIEALFQTYTAGTDKSNKEASATLAAGGTYSGQSMALNGISVDGAISDAFTPTYVNTGATWDSGGTGFDSTNAVEIIDYMINQLSFGNKSSDRLDCAMLNRAWFIILKQALHEKERIIVTGKADGSTGLGTNWEEVYVSGLPVTWDAHIAANTGYGLNFDHIFMDQLQVPGPISGDKVPNGTKGVDKSMFDVEAEYLGTRRGFYITATSRGQYRFNPRFQAKIADFTS